MIKFEIHQATVTRSDLHYVGPVTVGGDPGHAPEGLGHTRVLWLPARTLS